MVELKGICLYPEVEREDQEVPYAWNRLPERGCKAAEKEREAKMKKVDKDFAESAKSDGGKRAVRCPPWQGEQSKTPPARGQMGSARFE